MNKWKSFTLVCIVAAMLIGAALLFYRLWGPGASEIERVFDGSEAVFIEGHGLLSAWRTLGQTDYWKSSAYEGLLELPPVRRSLDTVNSAGTNWIDKINPDAVMSALGDECALGVYTEGGSYRFLFASRVDPNFLLVDRLLAFAGSDAGITVTSYRSMRVKEAALDKGRQLLWALDGDLLILSNDRDIFYAAVDRHIDGKTGHITSNRDFRRMKRSEKPSLLIQGYAVMGRLGTIPEGKGILSDLTKALAPESIRFWASYAEGVAALHAETTGGFHPLWFSSGNTKEPLPLPDENEIFAARVGRMPFSTREKAVGSTPEPPLPALLPSLFPDGFSVFVVSDPRGAGGPATIAVGGRSASFLGAVARLRETPGFTQENVTTAGGDILVLDNGGFPYLAWTDRDGRIIVSDRPELLAAKPPETLETAGGFGYNSADGEVVFSLRPRRMYSEMAQVTEPISIPFGDLSLDEQRRLWTALYPARRIDGYLSAASNRLKIDIGIHVEDVLP